MSLDVSLEITGIKAGTGHGSGIFIRENGQNREISEEEWAERFPGKTPIVVWDSDENDNAVTVYSANITHNLNRMASECGLYYPLWQPGVIGAEKAEDLIPLIKAGLMALESDRPRFEKFNPSSGWGDYDGLVRFARDYLRACEQFPSAKVYASR